MALQKNKWGVYYFRTTIPADVSPTGKPKDFVFSLYTTSYPEARVALPQVQSAFLYLVTYCRRAGQVLHHKANPRRSGNLMYDLIASMMVGDTEVTIKSTAGNETAVANIIHQVLSHKMPSPNAKPPSPKPNDVAGLPERKVIRIDVLYEQYSNRQGVTSSTNKCRKSLARYISELFGTKRMCDVSRDEAFDIKNKIQNLKSVGCDGKSRNAVSPALANRIFQTIASFFKWGVAQGNIDYNPFEGMELDLNAQKEEVVSYSIEEMKLLFEGEEFQKFTENISSRYWLCVLGVYTGMRVGEIAQLEVGDVKIDKNGRYFFELTEKSNVKGHTKQLKTSHSERVVPLCQKIIALGFDRYFETIKKDKYDLLFPDIPLDAKTHQSIISQFSTRFSEYRRRVLDNNKKQTFHSLRHNVVCLLQQKKVPLPDIQEFVGHAHGNITFDVYGGIQGAEAMVEVADKIDFDINFPVWKDSPKLAANRRKVSIKNKEIRKKG